MTLAGGTVLVQALGVISSPILTRIYTTDEFGLLAVFASVLALASSILSFKYEYAIPLPDCKKEVINLVILCITLVIITSSIFAIISYFFYDELLQLKKIRLIGKYIWLLPVGFLFTGFYNVFNLWAVRERIYPTIARTKISQGVTSLSTQLGLGLLKFGPLGLLFGQVLGQSAGVGTLVRKFWSKNKADLSSVSFLTIRHVAYRYKSFPLYQSIASLMISAGSQVPSLLLAAYYGVEIAGLYFLTQKVLAVPISLIGTSVSKVFWGEAARLTNEPKKLQRLYKSLNKRLLLYAFPPTIFLVIGGQWIFKFVFGPEWIQSGLFIQVMAFQFLLKFTTDSAISFFIINRQDISFSWALLRLFLAVFSIMAAVWYGLPAFWAVVFMSAAMSISYIVKYCLWGFAIKQMIINHKKAK